MTARAPPAHPSAAEQTRQGWLLDAARSSETGTRTRRCKGATVGKGVPSAQHGPAAFRGRRAVAGGTVRPNWTHSVFGALVGTDREGLPQSAGNAAHTFVGSRGEPPLGTRGRAPTARGLLRAHVSHASQQEPGAAVLGTRAGLETSSADTTDTLVPRPGCETPVRPEYRPPPPRRSRPAVTAGRTNEHRTGDTQTELGEGAQQ